MKTETSDRYTVTRKQRVYEIVAIRRKEDETPYNEREGGTCPADIAELLFPIFKRIGDEDQEHVVALFLSTSCKVTGWKHCGKGNENSCVMTPSMIFRAALLEGASCVIVAHNHPSDNLTPSREDIAITRQMVEAGQVLGIKLFDHIIIAQGTREYNSLAEKGYI